MRQYMFVAIRHDVSIKQNISSPVFIFAHDTHTRLFAYQVKLFIQARLRSAVGKQ
jgi:hypothetical protein